jgi:hypothetical protein
MHSEPVQTALKRLRQANNGELAALQVVGKADAALDHLDIDRGALQNPSGNAASSLLTRIVPVFRSRRKSMADRQLSAGLEQAPAMEAGVDILPALKSGDSFSGYAWA